MNTLQRIALVSVFVILAFVGSKQALASDTFVDIFRRDRSDIAANPALKGRIRYAYTNWHEAFIDPTHPSHAAATSTGVPRDGFWRLFGAGPDKYLFYQGTGGDYSNWAILNYDPTNGTVSYGDIFRTQRRGEGTYEVWP